MNTITQIYKNIIKNRLKEKINTLTDNMIDTIVDSIGNLARLDKSLGNKLTLKQKMTRYASNFSNIENLIFNVIPYISD